MTPKVMKSYFFLGSLSFIWLMTTAIHLIITDINIHVLFICATLFLLGIISFIYIHIKETHHNI